jgi:pyruvate formate-lyase/glycerol dehydratase family glycyl radical enzyme
MAKQQRAHPEPPKAGSDPARLAVLNIQRTCVHDGPGVRSTVFFQGCPLACKWCQNPEAQAFTSPSEPGVGRSVDEVMGIIHKDRPYYDRTQGGVTLSGGDPLAQDPATLVAFLDRLKSDGLDVTVETAGDVPWRVFEAVMPRVDLFLFDLKAAGDPALHEQLTGRDGRRIEDNLRRLVGAGAQVRVRMCVVPEHNDQHETISAVADLLTSVGHSSIELMRYYDLHEKKAERLGVEQAPLHITAERALQAREAAAEVFNSLGITVHTEAAEGARSKAAFTKRVHDIQRDIRDAGYKVCLESARLKTAWYREHGFEGPLLTQRAELLRHLLNRKRITVYRHELLVGNYTAKRVGGNVWLEYFGSAMLLTLWGIDRQTPVGFACSWLEKLQFYTRLAPFWLDKGILARAFPSPLELGLYIARTVEKRVGFNNNMAGIAHYAVNTERLLRLGTTGIAAEVEDKRGESDDSGFYGSVLVALRGLEDFADRYAAHLRSLALRVPDANRRAELEHMAGICSHVPRLPARTLHEALQAILFLHVALCTESFENAISLGRLDQVLQPYLAADLEAGRLDLDKARELVACFVLKIDEVVFLNDGDSLFQMGKLFESLSPVETVTVGGVDRSGTDATNAMSYLILDACELRPIGINMAARIHEGSPAEYVERIAEVYLNGSPMPALYNDEAYVAALCNEYGTSVEDARDYSIVGCVEPVASDDHFANTDSANINVVMPFLQALRGDQRRLWSYGELTYFDKRLRRKLRSWSSWPVLAPVRRLRMRAETRLRDGPYHPPSDMEQLMERFAERMNELVRDILADQQRIEAALARNLTTPLASAMYRGCIDSGKDVYQGGTTINSSGIQAVGVTDVADSLAAIDALVFQQGRYTLAQLLEAMDANFEGKHHRQLHEDLLAAPKFGDDDATDAHEWVHKVLDLYVAALQSANHDSRDGRYVAGYYGLNVNMVYGRKTPALPSGRLFGTPLANSICPHYGMQKVDLSSAFNAVARVDFGRYAPNGTTLTSTIDSGLFPGRGGTRNLAGLITGFFAQGGMQLQPNLVDRKILQDAFDNPGKHPDLVVRIAGYCAYFDDLSDDLKLEIINRSYYTQA